jgi:hypothetical protein
MASACWTNTPCEGQAPRTFLGRGKSGPEKNETSHAGANALGLGCRPRLALNRCPQGGLNRISSAVRALVARQPTNPIGPPEKCPRPSTFSAHTRADDDPQAGRPHHRRGHIPVLEDLEDAGSQSGRAHRNDSKDKLVGAGKASRSTTAPSRPRNSTIRCPPAENRLAEESFSTDASSDSGPSANSSG